MIRRMLQAIASGRVERAVHVPLYVLRARPGPLAVLCAGG